MDIPAGAVILSSGQPYPSERAARLASTRPDLKGKDYAPHRLDDGAWCLVQSSELEIPRSLMAIGLEARRGRDGIGVERVRFAVDPVLVQWPEPEEPDVDVVETLDELPVAVLESLESLEAEGLYVPGQCTTYLIADRIYSTDHARRVLAHLFAAHMGLKALLSDDFQSFAQEVDEPVPAALAGMVRDSDRHPVAIRLVAAVRRALRRLGIRLSFDREEVRDIIARATYRGLSC